MTLEELQAINYHWRLAIDQVNEGVVILEGTFDQPGKMKVVYGNRAFRERLGYGDAAVSGQAFAMCLPEGEEEKLAQAWRELPEGHDLHGRFSLRTASGERLGADWTVSSRVGYPGRTPDHTVTLTWRGGANESLSEEDAFEMSKADTISHIAKGMVHDFNNSLMAIRGHLEVALSEMAGGRGSVQEALEATEITAQLCQRLLAYARGRQEEKRSCSVEGLVQQAVSISCLGSKVTCIHRLAPDLWPILADGIQVVQVINNLLMNAQQAMPSGGAIVLSAKNVPVAEGSSLGLPPGKYVAMTVRDRGVGIPDDLKARIFDSMFTTKTGGSGLGLSTCARIVSAHEGYIDVKSSPNRGSEFIVYLPAAPLEVEEIASSEGDPFEAPAAEFENDAGQSPFPLAASNLKVLLIEDQKSIAQIADMYLSKLGHEITCAATGQRGVSLYRNAWRSGDPFDVVIVDMTLPGGMSGEDAFRELQRIDPHVIGVATSGSIEEELLPAFRDKGFAAILPKPFPLHRLSGVLEEAVACQLF